MTDQRIWQVANMIAVLVLIALYAFAIGRHYGREGVDSYARVIPLDPRWAVIAIPPCTTHPLSTEAVGLTYVQAWRHASDLAQLEGMQNVRGRPIPTRDGVLVCP